MIVDNNGMSIIWLPWLGWCDSWYNSGCGDCGTCSDCNSCSSCPNIVGSECIQIDKTNPDTRIISTECNPIVKSTDATVLVTPSTVGTHKEYNLSVTYQDKKVAVSPACTAGFLEDQITVTWALTKSTVSCKVQLWIDATQLTNNFKDEKVATAASCTPWFLEDQITVGAWLRKTTTNCKVNIAIDCTTTDCNNKRHHPAMQLRVSDTVTLTQANHADAYYLLTSSNAGWSSQALMTTFTQDVNYWCIEEENWWIKIKQAGLYHIWFWGNQECSEWVNGSRVFLIKYTASTATYSFPIASRYSWWSDWNIWPANAWESNNSDITANGASWLNIWLGKYLERLPFGGDWLCWLKVWDRIGIGAKVSTRVEDPSYNDPDAKFAILGATEAFAGGDSWAHIYAYCISDFCLDTTTIPDC